jgi:hypothetical protein
MLKKVAKVAVLIPPLLALMFGFWIRHTESGLDKPIKRPSVEYVDFSGIANLLERQKSHKNLSTKSVEGLSKMVRMSLAQAADQPAAAYYDAARILRLSNKLEDQKMAHDFAVLAAYKGEQRALAIAAETEDRMLVASGQAQRFGTVKVTDPKTNSTHLAKTDPDVSDALRQRMGVPPLAAQVSAATVRTGAKKRLPIPMLMSASPTN